MDEGGRRKEEGINSWTQELDQEENEKDKKRKEGKLSQEFLELSWDQMEDQSKSFPSHGERRKELKERRKELKEREEKYKK